ncbi:DNA ligase (ATP) [Thermosinus carboxydivorans Nor1]|uniref:DNA ligase (ATP) n=1 Tax=Thermosinus carboxydivorans Nor1 TaxID=401526 RepID=A1HS46_9FIRM|nr:non-homologous end-joining DNA ligase [Thermosinus carboxydivorans]EAX47111.1 DNA ligase (ATP) [Thermosinus carboxydivorans Nor1]
MQIIPPMLAKPATLPADEKDYGFEIKWDGIRAVIYLASDNLRILSRNLKDVTRQYPELMPLTQALAGHSVILDGEIVAFDINGRPSFARLQNRMGLASDRTIARKTTEIPATYIIFDLLYIDGQSTLSLPYIERRRLLEELDLNGPNWQTPAYKTGQGRELLLASRRLGLEGIVAKKLDSIYLPGKRPGTWLKIKNVRRQEFVIGGWLPGQGTRTGMIGALLLGYYDRTPKEAAKAGQPQRLLFAGAVGTGFTHTTLKKLQHLLKPLEQAEPPFAESPPLKGAVFVKPALVGEVEFTEWTPGGTLRHPSFKGLRNDKDPRDILCETKG